MHQVVTIGGEFQGSVIGLEVDLLLGGVVLLGLAVERISQQGFLRQFGFQVIKKTFFIQCGFFVVE
jgi:hypothetical protein